MKPEIKPKRFTFLSGIFRHFFVRVALMQLASSCLLILVVLPFFNEKVHQMASEQGKTFARSTLSASYDHLYVEDYANVVDYYINVLKGSPTISFVIFSKKKDGQEFIITAKNWSLENRSMPYQKIKFKDNNDYRLVDYVDPVTKREYFIYSEPILMKGYDWGVITIGMSKNAYTAIVTNFYWSTVMTSIALLLLSILVFYISSRRIRGELQSLQSTAELLADGKLTARASENAIGEIGVLGQAINSMSTALEEQSRRVLQLVQVLQQTNDAFVLFDPASNIVFINDAITELSGYPASKFEGLSIVEFRRCLELDLSDMDDMEEMNTQLEWVMGSQNFTTRDAELARKDGSVLDIEIRIEMIENLFSQERNLLMVISDISHRKKLENELHQLAFYDKLTGIPNRRMFTQALSKTIATSKRNKTTFALFFLDLDDFKFVNDTLGHDAGDALLIEVTHRLKSMLRSSDTVSRLGGDEFTIILSDINPADWLDTRNVAEKITRALSDTPAIINNVPVAISTSIGIAQYPDDGDDQETLLKNADIAMYTAKKSGKNQFAFFSDDMNSIVRQHLDMENSLKQALGTNQIQLMYQPIVRLDTQQLIGVEALARWEHPVKGAISPVEFIPLAEKSDLIIKLSDQLFNMAFRQMHEWNQNGYMLYMSINISARQFEKEDFIELLLAKLNVYDLDPHQIQLEFTESIMFDASMTTISKFESLKYIGFKLALDDFGTGYSSLSYIHQLPIDIIKIDRSFVISMLENTRTDAIISAITKLSENLGIKTIAEGIETQEQMEWLQKHECNYGQGYLFDQPLSARMIEEKYLLPVTMPAAKQSLR